jgi:hypothetical protein
MSPADADAFARERLDLGGIVGQQVHPVQGSAASRLPPVAAFLRRLVRTADTDERNQASCSFETCPRRAADELGEHNRGARARRRSVGSPRARIRAPSMPRVFSNA